MLNLKNEKDLAEAIGKAEEYALRTKDFLPYPDKEVEDAVRVLANWLDLKSAPRPKILWLGKATKKELAAPKKMGMQEIVRRSARYYEGMRAVENTIWGLSNEVSNQWFGYYVPDEEKAPDELVQTLRHSDIGWGRRRLDDLINRAGTIRGKFNRHAGPRPSAHASNWTIPKGERNGRFD